MNAYELTSPAIESLRKLDLPKPAPRPGEVVLRLRSAALNFLDLAVATGMYSGPKFPIVPVADGAGEIDAIADDVSGWKVGDRAIPHFMPMWLDGSISDALVRPKRGVSLPGSLAQYVAVPASALVAIPSHLSFDQASTLPVAATTAWRAMSSVPLGPHSTVLLLGTGGVAIFALQFAKAHGAKVIITSSSNEKLRKAKGLGADIGVNYREHREWDHEVLRLTDGRGVDLVLETGGEETFERSVNASALSATIFVIGFLSGNRPTIDVLPVMEKQLKIQGNNTGPVASLREAAIAISKHQLFPVIDRVFSFDEAPAAYKYLQSGGQHFGKIVVSIE